MTLSGEFIIKAPREVVFDALADARFFASCIDGVSELTQSGDARYAAVLEARVAYMAFRFNLAVEMVRVNRPELIEVRIEGAPVGITGRLTATSVTRLTEASDGTSIRYAIEAAMTGTLGSLAQPVLKAKAKELEKQFIQRLRAACEKAPTELP